MATDREVKILGLGDDSTAEMRPVREAVPRGLPVECVRRSRDVVAATSRASAQNDWFPGLIVVCQNWPDEFSAADVQDLLATFPLSRLLCCYGPWCESDGRSRTIWPTGCRVAVPHAARRIERECDALRSGRTGDLPPLTAARDEVFEFEYARPLPRRTAKCALTVTVDSPDSSLRRMLALACATAGWRVVSGFEPGEFRLVLWDADPWLSARRQSLIDLRNRSPAVSIVAVAELPNADLVDELLAAGADRVVPKLAPLEQLITTIGELVAESDDV